MARFRWKNAFTVLLVSWFLLGALVYALHPLVLTGNRLLDAVLLAAAATFLLAQLVEVFGIFLLPFRDSGKRNGPA